MRPSSDDSQLVISWARYTREIKRLASIGAIGVANTCVGLGFFWLAFYVAGLELVVSNILAYGAGFLNSALLNRLFMFSARVISSRSFGAAFLMAASVAYGANFAVLWILAKVAGLPPALAQVCAMVTFTLLFYFTLIMAAERAKKLALKGKREL